MNTFDRVHMDGGEEVSIKQTHQYLSIPLNVAYRKASLLGINHTGIFFDQLNMSIAKANRNFTINTVQGLSLAHQLKLLQFK